MDIITSFELTRDWSWKQRDHSVKSILDEPQISNGWRATTAYPSEIHVELMKAGLIPDPYLGFNEHKVQWVGEAEWLYKCTFSCDKKAVQSDYAVIEFLGLDTVCDVYMNDKKILETDNMFRTYSFQLPSVSDLQSTNTLLLHFKSAAQLAKSHEQTYEKVRAGSTNLGDPSRVYVRKAQYDWRWDWGPELMTCGPYRPIVLRTYTLRISEVHAKAIVSDTLSPSLIVDVNLHGTSSFMIQTIRVSLIDLHGTVLHTEDVAITEEKDKSMKNVVHWKLDEKVKLWWPVGYGDQPVYEVAVSLLTSDENAIDTRKTRVGFRSVQLIQEPLVEPDQYGTGTTFLFEINGVRMFMGGSNWIPADNFLTTITEDRYRAWLTLLRDGNQNMVRLWGGGIYEPDVFYNICDELGILVWQDFQFACGVYPAHDAFVESVRKEAEDNVKRLRHHPSLAIFCGNNEDYQQVMQWGDVKSLPARKIYEEVLPAVVEALTYPPIPYRRGSPYGGVGWDTTDPTVGDVHQWDVWAGKELPYQEYDRLGGRFVSEFGLPSMPCMQTIEYWMDGARQKERYAQSAIMAQHCRAGNFERRFAVIMDDNFRMSSDLETTTFNRQLMQSEGVGYAYQVWRRKWGEKGKQYTGGALVWQLNDCWPVTSWAIADYFLRPKPVYYTISRQLAPVSVGIFRTVIKNRPNDKPRQFYEFGAFQSRAATIDIWGTNASLTPRTVTLELHCADLASAWTYTVTHTHLTLLPNQTTELLSIPCPCPPKDAAAAAPTGYADYTTSSSVVVAARLLDESGAVLARHADWPQPFRYLDVPDPGLKVEVVEGDGDVGTVKVSVGLPAKCVVLSVREGNEVRWGDNALDMMPGDAQVVSVRGLGGREVEVAYLGKEKATPLQ